MKDLTIYIAKALVDKPEEVAVTEIKGGEHFCDRAKSSQGRYWKYNRQKGTYYPGYKNNIQYSLYEKTEALYYGVDGIIFIPAGFVRDLILVISSSYY